MTLADDNAIPVCPLAPILVLVPVCNPILLNVSTDATFVIRRDIGRRIVYYIRKQDNRH
jgi:hypothetical protein